MAPALVAGLLVGGARSAGGSSGLIAFTRADGLYVMRADGSRIRRLMQAQEALAGGVAWSPDGSKLVFADWEGIWVMNADGRQRARLAEEGDGSTARPANFEAPTWSPDGQKIAFTAFTAVADDSGNVWVMNADGTKRRPLKTPGLSTGRVDWSPAGGWFVFESRGWVAGNHVWVMRTDGSKLRRLASDASSPAWSPDGRRIVFSRHGGIWVMGANGRSQVRLTSTAMRGDLGDLSPDWSRDGRKIAFARRLGSKIASYEIYVMNADGTGMKRLTRNRIAEANPAWQPVASGA